MLDYKPDLSLGNKLHWDWTALHTAILQDNAGIVGILIKAGADPEQKDAVGRDAKVLAEEYRKERVIKFLSTTRRRR